MEYYKTLRVIIGRLRAGALRLRGYPQVLYLKTNYSFVKYASRYLLAIVYVTSHAGDVVWERIVLKFL